MRKIYSIHDLWELYQHSHEVNRESEAVRQLERNNNLTLWLVAAILIILLQTYVIWEGRLPGVTFVWYGYEGRHCQKEFSYGFLPYKIIEDTDVPKAVIDIKEGTKKEKVEILWFQVLRKNSKGIWRK